MPKVVLQRAKLILFDMMGTLLFHRESENPYWYRLGELLESEGIMDRDIFNDKYNFWRKRRGPRSINEITLKERLKEIVPVLSTQDAVLDHLVYTYISEYESKTEPCEGVEEMLSVWAQIIKLGVVSNFFIPGVPERILKRHGLFKYIHFIIDSAQVGYRKPAREIYIAALLKAGMEESEANQVIFIGDDIIADIEGPRQIGMSTILYSSTRPPESNVSFIRSWNDFRP